METRGMENTEPRRQGLVGSDEVTGRIIGCAIEVHRQLGPGLHEGAYGAALEVAFRADGLRFRREAPLLVRYRNQVVGTCRPDFIVEEEVVLEVKRAAWLDERAQAQILAYLRASGLHLGLLINFQTHPLARGIRRFVL
jgi:GxxExxY protein